MSYEITFRSIESLSPPLQCDIVRAAEEEFCKFSWSQLTMPVLEDDGGHLFGDCTVTLSPGAADSNDARSENLPDARLTELLSILCSISHTHHIDWEVAHDYGVLGLIRGGEADGELREFCEGFNEAFDGAVDDADFGDVDHLGF